MALSEVNRMKYEQLYLEKKPSLTENEARSPDKSLLSFDAKGFSDVESLVLKLTTDKGTETLSLNPMVAYYLAMILIKGIQQNGWIEIDTQFVGQPTQQ